jgi:hypothetical protein
MFSGYINYSSYCSRLTMFPYCKLPDLTTLLIIILVVSSSLWLFFLEVSISI